MDDPKYRREGKKEHLPMPFSPMYPKLLSFLVDIPAKGGYFLRKGFLAQAGIDGHQ
jgi:hypothetical protein